MSAKTNSLKNSISVENSSSNSCLKELLLRNLEPEVLESQLSSLQPVWEHKFKRVISQSNLIKGAKVSKLLRKPKRCVSITDATLFLKSQSAAIFPL